MNYRRTTSRWRPGRMFVLLCALAIPHLSFAGTAPPIPTGPLDGNGQPATPDYYTTANWANSPPLAKFVDKLPGLGSAKANNLGQYLSVGKPDIVSYPGSDYYEIDLVEFRERMHSDLPAPGTLLRGYVQVNKGTNTAVCGGTSQPACSAIHNTLTPDPVRQLGPTLVAQRDRPVRIKFTNRLPVGAAGDLFIPVDATIMGAGTGPASPGATRGAGAPCDNTVEPNSCASYTHNRAAIHLHGGRTPWISDGTPHQWITPAEEITPFTKGVSFKNVPDMPDPGDGSMTYYYTNQQSARLMFYHDHAFGITRLNVYAGEAAGYLITDQWEQDLVNRGIIPADQIPLIIQDKTFVDATVVNHPVSGVPTPKIRVTDPLWNWGSGVPDANGVRPPVTGDLWLPHVYMPAQTLAPGFGGVNPFGRWMYGPWFYPATAVPKGPVANPYYDADCSSPIPAVYANCTTPGQPTMIPGTPHPSMGMEAFQDSAVVNGTVFPTLTVDPRAYRFRILNAASDRFWNLSFYKADPAQVSPDTRPASRLTEVKMVPASATLATQFSWPADWPVDGRDGGVPDPALMGPSFLQIGTEGGFLPQPVERFPQPVTYITDPTAFWVGVVDKTGLALGPAERADVIVDFSAYAGQTLILYNDAPAAWPARVAGYDYYTGAPDLRDSGGYGTGGTFNQITGAWEGGTGPLVGYAPNTRTVMQVIVRSSTGTDPAYSFNRANLEAEFTASAPATAINPIIPGTNPPRAMTLFERAQEPIIVGQTAYSTTYPNSYFPPNFPWEGINQINDHFLQYLTLAGEPVITPTEPKGIHDEMGASFDPVYGRMSGNLAMQLPNPTTLNALLVLYGFSDLPTETVNNSTTLNVTVIPDNTTGYNKVADGTQIWKISHNGVDTHPIHFHIFDVQLINRVGWDGQIALPEPNELGWKDTIKISPLMDTIVAVRPRAPALPFGIANSLRPLNPAIPIGSPMGFNSVDWTTGQARVPAVTNILYDYKWEYVWHCHILSHEEMDMMRPIVLTVANTSPDAPVLTDTAFSGSSVNLTWTDPTPVASVATPGNPKNEIGFGIYRCTGLLCTNFTLIDRALANATSYSDFAISPSTNYRYQVMAFNAAGDSVPSAIGTATSGAVIAPTIAITSPANGSTFTAGDTITIDATTTTPNGVSVTDVQFFDGATLLATDTTAPYSFSWTGATVGAHSLTAVVTPSTGATVTAAGVGVTVVNAGPATGVIITPSLTSPQASGIAVQFTASGTGSSGYQYQFYLFDGTSWTLVQDYGVGSSWTLPANTPAGNYTIAVNVRTNAAVAFDAVSYLPYQITGASAPATGVIITPNLPAPQTPGTAVQFTASGTGSSGYQYQFYLFDGTSWTLVQDYGVGSSWTLPANTPAGNYTIAVNVRTSTTVSRDAVSYLGYQLTAATTPATGVIITPSLPSPQVPGTAVQFTASGTGSSGYQYQFYLFNGTSWSMVQDYGVGSAWTLPSNTPAGSYTIAVNVRTSSAVSRDAVSYLGYQITVPATPATGVIVTPSLPSPQTTGTAVQFSASGTGSTGYQYQFYLFNGTSWSMAQDYGVGSVWTLPSNTPAGSYTIAVNVRTSSAVVRDAVSYTPYVIQ